MTSACQATACTGPGFNRLDFLYDSEGNRTKITATPASGSATTTTFRYRDGLVASEVEVTGSTTSTRTFTTGPDGAIAKIALATTPTPGANDGTYLVRWNGHGDAIGLERVTTATGALTPVTSWTYSTWGSPTRSGLDLGFRYLYVGSADVQWDDQFSLGLAYMHARHYSPSLGRFLQPDPARADARTYRYAGNNPVTLGDPTGLAVWSPWIPMRRRWHSTAGRSFRQVWVYDAQRRRYRAGGALLYEMCMKQVVGGFAGLLAFGVLDSAIGFVSFFAPWAHSLPPMQALDVIALGGTGGSIAVMVVGFNEPCK